MFLWPNGFLAFEFFNDLLWHSVLLLLVFCQFLLHFPHFLSFKATCERNSTIILVVVFNSFPNSVHFFWECSLIGCLLSWVLCWGNKFWHFYCWRVLLFWIFEIGFLGDLIFFFSYAIYFVNYFFFNDWLGLDVFRNRLWRTRSKGPVVEIRCLEIFLLMWYLNIARPINRLLYLTWCLCIFRLWLWWSKIWRQALRDVLTLEVTGIVIIILIVNRLW